MVFEHLAPERIVEDPLWLVLQFVIIFIITFGLGKVHEILHIYKAKKLGYRLISYKRWKNEVDIDIQPDDPNVKKIGLFPYIVLVPLGWLLLPIGFYFDQFGIFLAGLATVIIHGLSLRREGKA